MLYVGMSKDGQAGNNICYALSDRSCSRRLMLLLYKKQAIRMHPSYLDLEWFMKLEREEGGRVLHIGELVEV